MATFVPQEREALIRRHRVDTPIFSCWQNLHFWNILPVCSPEILLHWQLNRFHVSFFLTKDSSCAHVACAAAIMQQTPRPLALLSHLCESTLSSKDSAPLKTLQYSGHLSTGSWFIPRWRWLPTVWTTGRLPNMPTYQADHWVCGL